MNKNILLGVFCLTLLFCHAESAAQTLKLATIAPEGSSWMKDMRYGARQIEDRTEGRVKLKFYAGGVQGNDKQVLRKMRTGQLHGGAFTSGSMNMFQKDADLFSLAMMFNDHEEVKKVRAELEPIVRDRLEEAGYANFGFAGGGFAYMMSNRPLRSMSDLSGQKVWIPEGDKTSFAALRALGVAPVVMAGDRCHDRLADRPAGQCDRPAGWRGGVSMAHAPGPHHRRAGCLRLRGTP